MFISLPVSDEALLAECDVETRRARGKGGQHVNTTDSAVRLRHRPSGIVVSAQQERSQHLNKRIALERLRRKIAALNHRAPPRIPTRQPRSVKEKMLALKIRRGRQKRLRGKVDMES